MAKKSNNGFIRYTTYNFIEKDPVIDVLRTMKKDAEMTDTDISVKSKVAVSTLKGWFGGKTKRPRFATVAAAALAMGHDSVPVTPAARAKLKG